MKQSLLSLAFSLSLLSTASSANINTCDIEFNYDLNIDNQQVIIAKKQKELVKFSTSNDLYLEGTKQSLNAEQQELVNQMADGYRAIVPLVANVAAEAAELGIKAATLTMNALFAKNPELNQEFLTKLDGISERIKVHINETTLNGSAFSEDGLDQELEQEIESLVEKAITESSRGLIASALSGIFSGDEQEMKDFELRMEMFEQDIESQIEAEAGKIEIEAEKLCNKVKSLDEIETKLQRALPDYSKYNLIRAE